MKTYDELHNGARARLRHYRYTAQKIAFDIAAREAQRKGESTPALADFTGERWRAHRHNRLSLSHAIVRSDDYNGEKVIHADSGYMDHLRDASDRIATEWYCDINEWETVSGKVSRLPHERFLAWIKWSDCDGITILAETFDDESEAQSAADYLAERVAESERDYTEKCNAARILNQDCDELRDELTATRAKVKECAVILRALPDNTFMRNSIAEHRAAFAEALADLIEKRAEIAEYVRQGIDI